MSISDVFWYVAIGLVVAYMVRLFIRLRWMQYLLDRQYGLFMIYGTELSPSSEPYQRIERLQELWRRAYSHFWRHW